MNTEIAVSESEALGLQTELGQAIKSFDFSVALATHRQLMQSTATSRGREIRVMPEDIRVLEGFNPRIPGPEKDAHIRSLADSMKLVGFMENKPLACFAGKEGRRAVFYLYDGECRYLASQLASQEGAEIPDLPVVLAPEGTTVATLMVQMIRSNSDAKPFTPLELSILCSRLKKEKLSNEEIGKRLGFTSEYVRNLLTLSEAPQEIKAMVSAGAVAAALAVEKVREHGDAAAQVLETAVSTAKAEGRDKVRKSDFATHSNGANIKQAAPKMLAILQDVQKDTAFKTLPEPLREKIEALLQEIAGTTKPNTEMATTNEATKQE